VLYVLSSSEELATYSIKNRFFLESRKGILLNFYYGNKKAACWIELNGILISYCGISLNTAFYYREKLENLFEDYYLDKIETYEYHNGELELKERIKYGNNDER
jgi:hypothetical protein